MSKDLQALLAFHEEQAAHLRAVLKMLHERAVTTKVGRLPSNGTDAALRQALALEAARRNGHSHGHAEAPPYGGAAINARREKTAAFLAHFDRTTPRPLPANNQSTHSVGALVTSGYLKRKGDGYLRTAKPFVAIKHPRAAGVPYGTRAPNASPTPPRTQNRDAQVARRTETAEVLSLFHESEPRKRVQLPSGKKPKFAVLILNGYLKRKGAAGYVRTSKPFVVNPWAATAAE